MTIYFTGDEIIQMAVRSEETGYSFYTSAEKESKSQKLKELFKQLAGEELKHKEKFLTLKGSIREPVQGAPVDWDEAALYIQAMIDTSLFSGESKNINLAVKASDEKEAVSYALGFEKDTLLFYYQILELIRPAEKPVVEKIIQEEKGHIRKLSEVKKSI